MITVSIIIASYNYANFIRESIDSVIKQSYKSWELIIIDDGSKDNSLEVINQYVQKHPNIKLFTHSNNQNKGLKETIKLGLEKCSGKYIAFLESDDYWEDNYLDSKIDVFAQNPDVKLVFNDVNLFGDENQIAKYEKILKVLYKELNERNSGYLRSADVAHYFMLQTTIATFSSVIIEKSALLECNLESPLDAWFDWWLYAQIAFKYPVYYISDKLTYWRKHNNSYINSFLAGKKFQEKVNFHISLLNMIRQFKYPEYNTILLKACLFRGLNKKIYEFATYKESFIKLLHGKKIYLYGAGAFAEEILQYCNNINLDIAGFIDGNKNKAQHKIGKYTIFAKDDIAELKPDIIIISIKEWEPYYFELLEYLLQNNLNIPIVSNFFEEFRYKPLFISNNQLTEDELFLLI